MMSWQNMTRNPSSVFRAKCRLEASVKSKLAELHKLGYSRPQSYSMLLAHIAPGAVTHSLREAEIAEAMQVFKLDRGYAINALTIKYELISLRNRRGFDVLHALGVLDTRVKRMRVTTASRASAGGAKTEGGPGLQTTRSDETEDLHTEKRRRLTKNRCVALNPKKNNVMTDTRGNEENLVRNAKWGAGLGNGTDPDREPIEEEIADFKRVRTKI